MFKDLSGKRVKAAFRRRAKKAFEEVTVRFSLPSGQQKAKMVLDARITSNVAV